MSRILQLKISLNGIEPLIWRRFLVEDSITFHQLHKIIQKVMNWGNYHLYDFQFDKFYIEGDSKKQSFAVDSMWGRSIPKGIKTLSASKAKLNEVIQKKENFLYTYDFGDNWQHSIVVEEILEKNDSQHYPACTDGERACPPEDCGSVPGYYELMEIRKDKGHPLYEERVVEWLGEDYDPEEFDINKINEGLSPKETNTTGLRKLGRNEPCPCGSGKKYKKCCLEKDIEKFGRPIKI